ncbi:unnamed protein product [Brachionus calyciflorus]|uniref:Uncharacterized protein n=1 Tax=Brachionus calyciflorus TaxID=104777 RepID=A0A813RB46_9BILA|nr:unnamed protein product [Brachionus calyciflorus]
MANYLHILIGFIFDFIYNQEISQTCQNFKVIDNKPVIGIGYMYEVNFYYDQKDELDFNCVDLESNLYTFNIIPSNMLILSDNSLKFSAKSRVYLPTCFQFVKISAFYLDSNFFIKFERILEVYSVKFYYSHFKVLTKKGNECFFYKSENFSFFGNIKSVGFGFTTRYFPKTCPLIFSNSIINIIEIYGLTDNFLIRNKLEFLKINTTINSSIKLIVIKAFDIDLEDSILDEFVFKDVQKLELKGKIKKIFITSMNELLTILLKVENIKDFFYINQETFKNTFGTKLSKLIIQHDEYQFPNEDFCIFKEFYDLDWLNIIFKQSIYDCSCTIVLLCRFSKNKTDYNNRFYSAICSNN